MKFDFSGYVTKNDLKCSDGRIIRKDAFKDCDGAIVPLVWQHLHDDPENVLGHALLKNEEDGVYGYCAFNNTPQAQNAKELVAHGDIRYMSIYANQLKQNGSDVMHGTIREVSLVLAGANPGAVIDNVSFAHADGSYTESSEDAIINTGFEIDSETEYELYHEDSDEEDEDDEETVQDVIDSMTDKQRAVMYAIIGDILNDKDDEAAQSDMEEDDMKRNVFDGTAKGTTLTHSDYTSLMEEAKSLGSFRKAWNALDDSKKRAFLRHDGESDGAGDSGAGESSGSDVPSPVTYNQGYGLTYPTYTEKAYGIANIGLLFPEARSVNGATPMWHRRDMAWVDRILSGVSKTPFSRIKSSVADITEDDARAKGYITGNQKKEEVFRVMQRSTNPTTVYKKQKFDRDDVVDLTDFDVVAWVRAEMMVMLREEIAGAILVGDGRDVASEDKINEDCIRPIVKDELFYSLTPIKAHWIESDGSDAGVALSDTPTATSSPELTYLQIMDDIARRMINYEGSGHLTFIVRKSFFTELKLLKVAGTDGYYRYLYKSEDEVKQALGVDEVIPVPDAIFDRATQTISSETVKTYGIIMDLRDYTVGTDKGGQITSFDDFDIDYNQYKYLIEGRMSGALTKPNSVLVVRDGYGYNDSTGAWS